MKAKETYYYVEKSDKKTQQRVRVTELGAKLTKAQANNKCDQYKAADSENQYHVMEDQRS